MQKTQRRRFVWTTLAAIVMATWPAFGQTIKKAETERIQAAEPRVFVWREGDREMRATLVNDAQEVVELRVASAPNSSTHRAHYERLSIAVQAAADAGVPVFQQGEGGPILLPVGGVLVRLSEGTDPVAFFAEHGLNYEDWHLRRLYLIETEPGWAALDTVARLNELDEVESAQPNWWRERGAQ